MAAVPISLPVARLIQQTNQHDNDDSNAQYKRDNDNRRRA